MAACCTSMWGNPILYSYTVYSTYRNLISQMRRYEGQGVSLTTEKECSCLFVLPSSFVRVGNSLIGFSSESLVFSERKSDMSESLTVALLLWAKGANRSICSLKKSKWAKRDMGDSLSAIKSGKTVKNIQKYEFFEWIARFACDSLESRANHSHRSFLKSNKSDFERRAKERKSERANSQPCHL